MKNKNMARNKTTQKEEIAICKRKSKCHTLLDVAELGAKYGVSHSTVYRIWRNNKQLWG